MGHCDICHIFAKNQKAMIKTQVFVFFKAMLMQCYRYCLFFWVTHYLGIQVQFANGIHS
jgi:hypothetical protein